MRLIIYLVFPALFSIALASRGQILASIYNLLYSPYWLILPIMTGIKYTWREGVIFAVVYLVSGTILNLITDSYKIIKLTPRDYEEAIEDPSSINIWNIAWVAADIIHKRLK